MHSTSLSSINLCKQRKLALKVCASSTYLPADMFRLQGTKESIEHRHVYIQMKAIDELDLGLYGVLHK